MLYATSNLYAVVLLFVQNTAKVKQSSGCFLTLKTANVCLPTIMYLVFLTCLGCSVHWSTRLISKVSDSSGNWFKRSRIVFLHLFFIVMGSVLRYYPDILTNNKISVLFTIKFSTLRVWLRKYHEKHRHKWQSIHFRYATYSGVVSQCLFISDLVVYVIAQLMAVYQILTVLLSGYVTGWRWSAPKKIHLSWNYCFVSMYIIIYLIHDWNEGDNFCSAQKF